MANRPPYQTLQALAPQTIGYALTDSPVGQLVWIAERFAQWTDPRSQISDERMLTNISLYWLTATAASSARLSHETPRRMEVPDLLATDIREFFLTHVTRRWSNRVRHRRQDRGHRRRRAHRPGSR